MSLGFSGLRAWAQAAAAISANDEAGFGPIIPDPDGPFALPRGFSVRRMSRGGQLMSDGLHVPYRPDGMAAFPGPDGLTVLMRNHEMEHERNLGAFKIDHRKLTLIDESRVYDMGHDRNPAYGGVTTLLYDTNKHELVGEWMTLAGTVRNCAGGPTPWGSWVSCEEPSFAPDPYYAQPHGYCFEVPATARQLVEPIPLKAMGRFRHEAIAVHEPTGFVYLTEDREDGLIYRFIPNRRGDLKAGGRLQALAVIDQPSLDTRNWPEPIGLGTTIPVGTMLPIRWIDLDRVDTPDDDLRFRSFAQGAARFARAEGMWCDGDTIYFACTNGGREQLGQVWKYHVSPDEAALGEPQRPSGLELFIEPNDGTLVSHADNLTVAPWGDLVICEDSGAGSRLVGVTPDGGIYHLCQAQRGNSEFAGATFSPDGTTLFFNVMSGFTFAMTGPWPNA